MTNKLKIRTIIVLLIISGYTVASQIQTVTFKHRIDSLFSKWNNSKSPGASIVVTKDDSIIFKKGYGNANLEYNIKITPDTKFHVASLSKQFTAISILILASQNKLSLNDDIHKYLPEVPDFGSKITIMNLINHTSGIRDQWQLLSIAGWRLDDVITTEHIMKLVKLQKKLNFNPGEEYLYSNTGYTLLAEIVERVTGKSFKEWTAENIFVPLDMNDTHFHSNHTEIVKNRAYSYGDERYGGYKKLVLNYSNVGATSLFTTAEDMGKWFANFYNPKICSSEVMQKFLTKGKLNNGEQIKYGFGILSGKYRELKIIDHAGQDAGFKSYMIYFSELHVGIAVLSNYNSFAPWDIALKVADIYLEDELKILSSKPDDVKITKPKSVETKSYKLKDYAGRYLIQPNYLIKISEVNNDLVFHKKPYQEIQLTPFSEKKFYFNTADKYFEIEFEVDDKGNIEGLTYNSNGDISFAKKLPDNISNNNKLKEYVGEYYCDELNTTYNLIIRDSKLTAIHMRHPDIELHPTFAEEFISKLWWFSQIGFNRNEKGQILGFTLNCSRVKNLFFEKQ